MAEEAKENDEFNDRLKQYREKFGDANPGKRIFYTKLEHTKLVGITLDRDERIASLEKQKAELEEQIIELKVRLRIHEPEKYDRPIYTGYEKDWSVIRKVVFILKRNAKALTSLQVMEEL